MEGRSLDRRNETKTDLQPILNVLDNAGCRTIVQELDEPMTAGELATVTDIPLSTTYRKLDRLAYTSLLDTRTEVRRDGHHTIVTTSTLRKSHPTR